VQFVKALPRSGTGKIQWRVLQEKEWEQATGASGGPGQEPGAGGTPNPA
jgi:acyl-CoA synthetase (AMP-forming)/AMP-acid ligase II